MADLYADPKFGNKNDKEAIRVGGKKANKSLEVYLQEIAKKLPAGFRAKGNLFVFVDECHRTQGGLLHGAMRAVMGDSVMLVGFTGTPLLREDKKRSVETFGTYIHSYRFNEAVADGVILVAVRSTKCRAVFRQTRENRRMVRYEDGGIEPCRTCSIEVSLGQDGKTFQ